MSLDGGGCEDFHELAFGQPGVWQAFSLWRRPVNAEDGRMKRPPLVRKRRNENACCSRQTRKTVKTICKLN
jgi:hypothetical protein